MAWSLVNSTGGIWANSSSTRTSPSIDTTGANLLIVTGHTWSFSTETVSDSKGNTWNALTTVNKVGSSGYIRTFYSYSKGGGALEVGTGHTFSLDPATSDYITMTVTAWSGALASGDPFDQENGVANQTNDYVQPGSITPTVNGCLIIGAYAEGFSTDVTPVVDSPLTSILDYHDGSYMSGAVAWYEQATAAAINPGWTNTAAETYGQAAKVASFKPATGGITSLGPHQSPTIGMNW